MAQALRYPRGVLLADHARALGGLVLTAGPLALLRVSPWVGWPLALCAALFALFALRTLLRHGTRLTLDENVLRREGPFGTVALPWAELSGLSLRYYATRRARPGREPEGWMQMTLSGPQARIRIDSTLEGFDAIAERAAEAALRNGVALTPVTLDNLMALGIDAERPAR